MSRYWKALSLLAAAGCAAPADQQPPGPRPATVPKGQLEAVQNAIRAANGGPVAFGRPDGTDAPFLVLLPPPVSKREGRNLSTPTVYDIVIGPSGCYLDRRDSDAVIALDDVDCLPFSRDGNR